MGVAGFWNDMNEPSVFERADKTMPLDTVHRLDDGTTLEHRAVHNVFGMENARATYEGLRKLEGDERPFVLTRAGIKVQAKLLIAYEDAGGARTDRVIWPIALGFANEARVLVASFIRSRGERDRVHVRRSDGTETSWLLPTYGEGMPHDLVHLVVEAAFGLRRARHAAVARVRTIGPVRRTVVLWN